MSLVRRGDLYEEYKRNICTQYEGTPASIKRDMQENAWNIFKFHVENNPKYRKFLEESEFDYSNIETTTWEDIPFITKEDLKRFYPEISSEVYNYGSSGGSTNIPFKYPVSKESALFIWPAHWMVHELCGSKPYSPLLMLMAYGNTKKSLKKKVYHWLSNFYTFNAFTMNSQQMRKMYETIKRKKIQLIYGYSSAINQFLRYLRENELYLQLNGIITTSDNKLHESYHLAQQYCNCKVYDQYGAHDGDIFAFECEEHCGLHILHDLCTVEIIDGKIVLTAVKNRAFPFIRYQVGDIAKDERLIEEKCKCGRTLFRLKGIFGRNTYFIKDLDGAEISLMLFTYPFEDDFDILQYQVVEDDGKLYVNFISDNYKLKEELELRYMPFIKTKIKRNIEFTLNRKIYYLPNGKVPLYINIQENKTL